MRDSVGRAQSMNRRLSRKRPLFDRPLRGDYNGYRSHMSGGHPIRWRIQLQSLSPDRGYGSNSKLPSGDGLGLSCHETFSAIVGDGAINNSAAIDALPCVENEKKIREPLQHHQAFALRTFHLILPRWIMFTAVGLHSKRCTNLSYRNISKSYELRICHKGQKEPR